MKDKKYRDGNLRWIENSISVLYFLIIILLLGLVVLSVYGSVFGVRNFTVPSDPTSMFAMIIAGITITLGASIIIPKYLLQKTVEDEVEIRFAKYKVKLLKEYEKKASGHANTVDAHLSRMIAYLLVRKSEEITLRDKFWGIGFSLRSLKSYLKNVYIARTLGNDISPANYTDVIAINTHLIRYICDDLNNEIEEIIDKENRFKVEMLSLLKSEHEQDEKTLLIRTCKETFDICFTIFLIKKHSKDIYRQYEEQLNEILSILDDNLSFTLGFFIRTVIVTQHASLASDIINKSKYGDDDMYEKVVRDLINGLSDYSKIKEFRLVSYFNSNV